MPDYPDEHPRPTEATIKELYGCAFRCAHPECTKPLYRQDNDTGDRILNSRVAHIHARRKGGARWILMTSDENRSPSNLVLLCIEHSYEVDEHEDRFPAETLREWKRMQLAEYDQIQRAWPLSDAEAADVAAASFDERRISMERAGATSILAVARSAGLLAATARRARGIPLAEIRAWEKTWQRVRSSMVAWDAETGERIYAEPSFAETNNHRQRVLAALGEASAMIAPFVDTVYAEARTIVAADPGLLRWCEWIDASVSEVVAATDRWPAPPPFADDGTLEAACIKLEQAVAALSAKWRGDAAEDPPEHSKDEPVKTESEAQRLLREHHELLELARPFARVDHLPFDHDLYERVRGNLPFAADLLPLPSFLSIDLIATARLAAAIARNADEGAYRQLIVDATNQEPLVASTALLSCLALFAEKAGHVELAQEAKAAARTKIMDESFQDRSVWAANGTNGKLLLGTAADLCGVEHVSATIEAALKADPSLLGAILTACAQWTEHLDSQDWSTMGSSLQYRELPGWFPAAAILAEIRRQFPGMTAARAGQAERISDEVERLAAFVFDLAKPQTSES